jgi:hypothetical protein
MDFTGIRACSDRSVASVLSQWIWTEKGFTMIRMIRRNRQARPMNVLSMIATSRWRRLTISLIGLASAKSRTASATSASPQIYQPSGHGTARAHGIVDLSKLPTITPQGGASAQTPLPPRSDSLAPAQRQAATDHMRQQAPASGATAESQDFVGGGALPCWASSSTT